MLNLSVGNYKTEEEILREQEEKINREIQVRIEQEKLNEQKEQERIEYQKRLRTKKECEYVKLLKSFFQNDTSNYRIKIQLNNDKTFILLPNQINVNSYNEIMLKSNNIKFYNSDNMEVYKYIEYPINEHLTYMEILQPKLLFHEININGYCFKVDLNSIPTANAKYIDEELFDNTHSNIDNYLIEKQKQLIKDSGLSLQPFNLDLRGNILF